MHRIFSTQEVADLCGVAERTVAKWFDSGRLRGWRTYQGTRRIPANRLEQFLERHGMTEMLDRTSRNA